MKSNKYTKHIWVNKALKKEEIYREQQLWGGVYYLSPEENLAEVLIALNPKLNWTIKDNKQIINGYTVWDCKFYDNLEQASTYSKIVLDPDENKIANIIYDGLTHQVKGGVKFYKFGNKPIPWGNPDDVFDEDSDILFIFGEDGEVDAVHMSDFLFSNDFTYSASQFFRAAGNFFEQMGLSDDEIYYYTHAEPLVPNFEHNKEVVIISFFDQFNQVVTEKEALDLDRFSKQIRMGNVLKKEEEYKDQQLLGGTYYLYPEENIIEALTSLNSSLQWKIMSNKQMVNGYEVWESRIYTDLEAGPTYSKVVLDRDGNEVAIIDYDRVSHEAESGMKVYNYSHKPIPWSDSEDVFNEDSDIRFLLIKEGRVGDVGTVFVSDFYIFGDDVCYDALKFFSLAGDFFEKLGVSDEELHYYTHFEPLVPHF